jgi:hypothetical protein
MALKYSINMILFCILCQQEYLNIYYMNVDYKLSQNSTNLKHYIKFKKK